MTSVGLPSKWKTNWDMCCLCQCHTNEELKSPPTRYSCDGSDGYSKIASNIPLFHAINELPIILDPARLDEGVGIEQTLKQNNAKYHQSCRIMFNNTKLERAQKRKSSESSDKDGADVGCSKLQRGSLGCRKSECFLCEKEDPISELRQAMTMQINERMNECARNLNDGKLLAKLSAGDVVAQELKYHTSCLVSLYNKERAHMNRTTNDDDSLKEVYSMAFSELLTYIVETKNSSEGPNIFRLVDMVSLYKERLEQLGVNEPEINTTRLKDKLLTELHDFESYKKGKYIYLAFRKDIGSVLKESTKYSEAIILTQAAKILRRNMLDHTATFDGTFTEGNIRGSVPATLLQFVGMIEHGADIKSQLRFGDSRTDITLAQLLQYNCYARYKEGAPTHRHSKDRETPFPIYIGMSIFAKTRKKQLVETLYKNGISIPYDRVLEVSTQLGEAAMKKYVEDEVVCPLSLRRGLFTTAAMDNIDHNPTSTTATTSFHGTSISVFQHPTVDNSGEEREPLQIEKTNMKSVPEIPDSYTSIKPAYLTKKHPTPDVRDMKDPFSSLPRLILASEYEWLEKVTLSGVIDNVTWSAHHASMKRSSPFEVSVSSLLPLLRDQAHSVATIKHVMDKIKDVVTLLNPGQIPVIAADQPIYAVAKQIQWHWPEDYGEEKYVIMFGGLHVEMAALRSVGSLLKNSGWTGALTEGNVATPGTADSFLVASNVVKTREIHQVTAATLYDLQKTAYNSREQLDQMLSFDDWKEKRKLQSPQFNYWNMILTMELIIFSLVRSFREANFTLYCQSLYELIPFFFINGNVNYARWIPIHLKDMATLDQKHPELAVEFRSGKFVVHKSIREFSGMAIDQAHEQANAIIKGDGGAIGVTENPVALRRWMVAGPEVSRLVGQYETESGSKDRIKRTEHHDQNEQTQKKFRHKVDKLTKSMEEMGNPFMDESGDLIKLDTKDIANESSAEMVKTHYERGTKLFENFMNGLQSEEIKLYEPIRKSNIDFFSQKPAANNAKRKALKEDRNLFSRLFISCQTRECDLDEFFQFENQSHPAALSDDGKLHSCNKADLADILHKLVTIPETEPDVEAVVIDGSALVNTIPPRTSQTFDDYATNRVIPVIHSLASKYKRTDIVFDVYVTSSLKAETRAKRGHGARRRVTGSGKIPSSWPSFLRDINNKTELFNFLANKITEEIQTINTVIVTKEENVMSNKSINLDELTSCGHEEADSRIFVHARHAAANGITTLMIKANDTDILVIAVSVLPHLEEIGLTTLWVTFGVGQHLKWIPIHDLNRVLGPDKIQGIPFFHAFTGCDVASAFRGNAKKTAWQTWNVSPEVTSTFTKLSKYPVIVEDDDIKCLEKFVVTMYDKSSTFDGVDAARLDMFARKNHPYESIPPTKAALIQHTKRATYQAACIWGQATTSQPEIQSPSDWGWTKVDDQWQVFWTDLEPISKSCRQLTKCGCKKQCTGHCKCYRFGLKCTALCSCPCDD